MTRSPSEVKQRSHTQPGWSRTCGGEKEGKGDGKGVMGGKRREKEGKGGKRRESDVRGVISSQVIDNECQGKSKNNDEDAYEYSARPD